ncbi:hypothetical protein PILCRDRAFT_741189 [Piloderma croceum F 1598]|uniref:Uncharacterized protein n=1 Tax=Piloderma croceum (strain F 1598) TaxID=765440 RepID=A0A0C3B545_PILCF|nr:hypothetical protein PILCRDRAFT_741189 [Piloderma croceum F 1598]
MVGMHPFSGPHQAQYQPCLPRKGGRFRFPYLLTAGRQTGNGRVSSAGFGGVRRKLTVISQRTNGIVMLEIPSATDLSRLRNSE